MAADAAAWFDCSICLEPVSDRPVVTPFGHLYCGPCMRRWLRSGRLGAGRCPVCKAAVSEDRHVPLLGHATPRDDDEEDANGFRDYQRRRRRHDPQNSWVMRSNADCVYGSVAVAVLSWAFPDGRFPPPRLALLIDGQEQRKAEESLHQTWLFLAAYALLIFLLF